MLELSNAGLQALVSFLVWLVANVVYLSRKRSGTRGFGRIVAFWLGSPTTWLVFLLVREGSGVAVAPPPDDEEALLEAIREDRRLRRGGDPSPQPPHDPSRTPEAS